eukprot:3068816-Rhodomonas_salina.2
MRCLVFDFGVHVAARVRPDFCVGRHAAVQVVPQTFRSVSRNWEISGPPEPRARAVWPCVYAETCNAKRGWRRMRCKRWHALLSALRLAMRIRGWRRRMLALGADKEVMMAPRPGPTRT